MVENNNSQFDIKFGRYTPIRILGEGAMGRVYLAEDPLLKRKLAVKVIILDKNIDDLTRSEYMQRFIVEAQSSAKLNHPSIVTIHDVGNDNRIPWIVFEYVEGESLIDILNREDKLSLEQTITIGLQIASALSVAHKHEIIHRDIKPANILVDSVTHIAKLADFGIAKAPFTELTQEGKTIGSPGYMSPEQITGDNLDERSDIFSLGVVLYQMITGAHPFVRDTLSNTLYATIEGTFKPIDDYVANVPNEVKEIVTGCIATKKEERISSATELVKKLKALHLASKTAHFTFTEPKEKSSIVKSRMEKLREIVTKLLMRFKKGSGVIKASINNTIKAKVIKPEHSFLTFFKQMLKFNNPIHRKILSGIKKHKAIFSIGATLLLLVFVICIGYKPSLKEAVPIEAAGNRAGIERIKLSETEEQLLNQVKTLITKDDLDEAETIAKTLSKTKNIAAYGYMLLGLIYLKDEEYDDALIAFEQCIKEKKGDRVIKQNLPSLLNAIKIEFEKEKADNDLLQIVVNTFKAAKNPIVRNWTKEKQYWLRWNSVYVKRLAKLSVDSVEVYILDLQYAGSMRTRVQAAKTLGRIGDKRAILPLKNAVQKGFSDPFVSAAAERVLEESFNEHFKDK